MEATENKGNEMKTIAETMQTIATKKAEIIAAFKNVKPATIKIGKKEFTYFELCNGRVSFYGNKIGTSKEEIYALETVAPLFTDTIFGNEILAQVS